LTGFVGGNMSYVGDRKDNFPVAGVPRQDVPGYAQINARGGVRCQTWTFNLFVNNVADRRGDVHTADRLGSFVPIQPRTVGLAVIKLF
jgi:outer membrane receptor protein involved in Fe transport